MTITSLFKTLLLFSFLLIGHPLRSQVTYAYDKAGNRIARIITLTRSNTVNDSVLPPQSEMLGEMEIKIYPNPTRGQLRVEIGGLPENAEGSVAVYSMSGKLMYNQAVRSAFTEIDISGRPAGTYILKIVAAGKVTTWKIVKE